MWYMLCYLPRIRSVPCLFHYLWNTYYRIWLYIFNNDVSLADFLNLLVLDYADEQDVIHESMALQSNEHIIVNFPEPITVRDYDFSTAFVRLTYCACSPSIPNIQSTSLNIIETFKEWADCKYQHSLTM